MTRRMAYRCTTDDPAWKAVDAAREERSAQPISFSEAMPPAAIIQVEFAEELYSAILAECGRLVPGSLGGSRTAPAYSNDGQHCSVILSWENADGTATVFHVQAFARTGPRQVWQSPGKMGRIQVQVHGPWVDNRDDHWSRLLLTATPDDHVVADHKWYSFGNTARTAAPRSMKGFGGQVFTFRMLDGSAVRTSDDMWFAGTIPPAWRDRIPDTAVMIEGAPPRFMGQDLTS